MTGTRALPDPTDLVGLRARLATATPGALRHPIGLGTVVIGPTALDHLLHEVEAIRRPGPVVVLVDETPMRRGAEDLKAKVIADLTTRFETQVAVMRATGSELHADVEALAQADRMIVGAGCVVSVGAGTITDIAKDATMRAGDIPLVVVQTAVSVNAFSDDMAVLLRDGVKRTVPSRWPNTLLVDLGVIADAPADMNRAGFGELCSMFTAPADWYLANAVGMDTSYDPGVIALFRDGAEALLAGAARVRANDPAMLAELAARMTLTGIAMGVSGRTAPLSGTEHLLSHLLDMAAGAASRPLALHGAQVGVASVLAATVWHDTLERFDPAVLLADAAFPDPTSVEARVHAAFDPVDPSGRMAGECWTDVERKVARWHAGRARVTAFAADWDQHRRALAELVAAPEVLRAALVEAGAAATVGDLEPATAAETAAWALRSLPLMRDRFTVADLRFFSGTWDDATADALLGRSGILGAAAAHVADAGVPR